MIIILKRCFYVHTVIGYDIIIMNNNLFYYSIPIKRHSRKRGIQMTDATTTINKIIAKNDIMKWKLAQQLEIAPSYLSLQLRDGLKTTEAVHKYCDALRAILDERTKADNAAKSELDAINMELDKEDQKEQVKDES